MAPRRRPPKPRTSRIDAAIDAMKPYGFAKEVVTAKMRQLLKEYEGEYMFIELDAYAVLLDSLISDQDTEQQIQQEVATGETSNSKVKDDHALVVMDGFIDIPVFSSTTHTVLPPPPPSLPPPPPPPSLPPPPPSSPPPLPPPPPSSPPPPSVLDAVLLPLPYILPVVLPPPENVHPRRRKPCYGWISDDDELHFIILPSSFNRQISTPESPPAEPEMLHQQVQSELTSGRKNRLGGQSRWDLRPEDM